MTYNNNVSSWEEDLNNIYNKQIGIYEAKELGFI
jgi:hypothetical protein